MCKQEDSILQSEMMKHVLQIDQFEANEKRQNT